MADSPITGFSESPTASESDIERLDQHHPSPRSASRTFLKRVNELAAAKSRTDNAENESLDENENGKRHQKATHEKPLKDIFAEDKKQDEGIDMQYAMTNSDMIGLVSSPAFVKYWEWQVERVGMMDPELGLEEVPPSNMGLFALLPGELRNGIYRLAVLSTTGPYMIIAMPNQCSSGPCKHAKLSSAVPGILSTCQQLRHEAMPIFLAENTFKFDPRTVRQRCTANFFRAIGPYGRLIRKISIEIMVQQFVTGHSYMLEQKLYEIAVDCPPSHTPVFTLEIDRGLRRGTRKGEVDRVVEHMAKLNERVVMESKEQLLMEFLGSDVLADLVWACSKSR